MPKKDPPRGDRGTDAASRRKAPGRYKVVVFDDDDTPGELVACILGAVFGMHGSRAVDVTHEMARRGIAVCGVYPFEVAETKSLEVMAHARAAGGYGLMAEIEPA